MSLHPIQVAEHPSATRGIRLFPRPYGNARFFAVALICCAVLIAGFAATEIWRSGSFSDPDGMGAQEEQSTTDPATESPPAEEPPVAVPENGVPIVERDLSFAERGSLYINNVTSYSPTLDPFFDVDVSSAVGNAPLVLILHTHAGEGYWSGEGEVLPSDVGAATYTREESNSVLAVGRTLADTLNQKGITAIHCTVMHDDPSMSGSYTRAAESIRFYLEQYPTIQYVIDLHRDAVMSDDGEYVRAVTEVNGNAVAQVMPVVGSDGNGFVHPNWEKNLALALQLRALLNAEEGRICRPVYLRNETFNQELAPYALLLEIGTGASRIEEAERAAILVGEALAELIRP